MPTKSVVVHAAAGLHARPAATLAQLVAASGLRVWLARADGTGDTADAASMLGIMGLGLSRGDTVTLNSDAPGSDALLEELGAVIESAE